MATAEVAIGDADIPRATANVARDDHARSWIAIVVLAMALALQTTFVIALDRAKPAFDHDEIISQMAASGHEDTWPMNGRTPPADRWVATGDIRHFLELDGQSSVAEVRRNLAGYDVHPPMYFWALLGAREAGLSLRWSGVILNIAFVSLAMVLLFFLCLEVLRDRLLAALSVLIFALSPALLRAVRTRAPGSPA